MCLHPPPVDSQRSRPRAQAQIYSDGEQMPQISHACVIALLSCAAGTAVAASRPPWPPTLPVYDHIVIVVEENRILNKSSGSSLTRRISENWRLKAPYSSACSPRSTIVKATI